MGYLKEELLLPVCLSQCLYILASITRKNLNVSSRGYKYNIKINEILPGCVEGSAV